MSASDAAGDLERGAVPKIRASLERGAAECESILNATSLGASGRNSYKGILLCRLETQYSLAMMKYCLKLEPAASKSRISVSWPGDLERVLRLLHEALDSLRLGDHAHSSRSIVEADRILGHMVAKLRGRGPPPRAATEAAGSAVGESADAGGTDEEPVDSK
ncbi:MAG TPA: hypothetical protein P5290_06285 [Candidatus Methanomethylicus sp.]|nr:hypothetical protein [Candidatus Methanomethylicus sp.]HRR54934.1 hypothetical protein [Candidatus Methanomethylicus sp.]